MMLATPDVFEEPGFGPEQRLLIQLSLDKALCCCDLLTGLFYQRLFELDPSVRPMFSDDLNRLGEHMRTAMAIMAESLDAPAEFRGLVDDLGRRHVGYGVKKHHYPAVREALFWSLDQCLGATFTTEVREAWERLFDHVAARMQRAGAA